MSDMVRLPGGAFLMGSDIGYPEEAPVRSAEVGPFAIDRFPVTNADFAAFVAETGHMTEAEISPKIEDFPDADPALLLPGSAVFSPSPPGAPALPWWQFRLGAFWHSPEGPGSSIEGRMDHPVVHVALSDAMAYADWARKSLPTEAEWEYAARGGLEGAFFAWGDELRPGGRAMANHWQGAFPFGEERVRTTPVGQFPPNGFGLFDMIGNVWEWTVTLWKGGRGCCSPEARNAARVMKGGSYLCAEDHCRRYRPAARHAQDPLTSTGHLGFRCITRG
ncbi:formylglycine-generating enzyme family protein [Tabrizicola oligotrophica]|uniref:Formylglycine-generating enzyme family protein n=1 Tax=Tabrizicola oligotrophica TaxID=2710650 RepID=A0A6M0QWD6_9RHOB|nr:formylglycine-generating enzyme family protein [Tabrizicola oligotrophica]NEY91786.1 formylglycine-generating enzyme family protein [Tabrizicola oligotrophica]